MTDAALTRRRSDNPHLETWHVYCGDVRVGTIGMRAGVPVHAEQWGLSCGFYPGLEPGLQRSGIASSFAAARLDFDAAWREIEPALTESAFQDWRTQRDFDGWKHAMWAAKLPLPTQTAEGRSRCFCGADITTTGVFAHVRADHRGIGV